MAPNVLPPEQCRRVVELASTLPAVGGRIGRSDVDPTLRASTIRWIPQDARFSSLYEAIAGAVFTLNQAVFGYALSSIEDMQFTTYVDAVQGFYDWHPDGSLNPSGDSARKLSMTLQLSEPSEHEGGELELWCDRDPISARKEQGLGIVFPAPVLHRVRPVTRGRRHSLVAWAPGPRFR
jgi:PKHD-type hydroxylase